jgi:hypothetical protein
MFISSIDHLDPLKSNFICGLDQENNTRILDLELNKEKSNAFVPYRLEGNDHPPMHEGHICWFLIEGEWSREPFCGERWWNEATRLGYSRTNTRGSTWFNNGVVSRMLHSNEPVPQGFVEGRIYTGWVCSRPSPNNGKIRSYNPETNQDGFFSEVPEGFIAGVPPSKRRPKGMMPAVTRIDVLEAREEICKRYLDGESTVDLGLAFKTSARTINNWLTKWGVPKRGTSRLNRPNKKK